MIKRIIQVFAVLLIASAANGAIVLNSPELWASGLANWNNNAPDGVGTGLGSVANPGSGGADADGYLQLTFPALGSPQAQEDTLYSSDSAYTGDYQISGLGVNFQFYVGAVAPEGNPLLYLHSAVSGNLWNNAITGLSAGSGWNSVTVAFDYDSGGWSGSGGSAAFWADLANIDWIGVNIARDSFDTSAQTFGIDSWKYLIVPEPGSMWILSVSLISIAAALRKKTSVANSGAFGESALPKCG